MGTNPRIVATPSRRAPPPVRLRRAGWLLGVVVATSFLCTNPFFPPMGLPQKSSGRGTPAGVIKQLMRSYTTRSLTLFEDLFARDGGFRYYVPQDILTSLEGLRSRGIVERIDRRFAFVDSGGLYEYITHADEVSIHRNMFEHSDEISFSPSLTIDSVYYHRTLVRIDSASVNVAGPGGDELRVVRDSVFDTTAAEVRTTEVTIRITSELLGTGPNGFESFVVGRQDFLLARDPEDESLWVIDKWFELP